MTSVIGKHEESRHTSCKPDSSDEQSRGAASNGRHTISSHWCRSGDQLWIGLTNITYVLKKQAFLITLKEALMLWCSETNEKTLWMTMQRYATMKSDFWSSGVGI